VDPKTFQPSPSVNIREGMEVIHLKFDKGKVNKIDGGKGNKIATIVFPAVDNPERRIMLKFANCGTTILNRIYFGTFLLFILPTICVEKLNLCLCDI